jgi:YtfJ family uncharacterized protein
MMVMSRSISGLLMALCCVRALAVAPAVDSPLPPLNITERGEITQSGDKFDFIPWRSDVNPGKVHIVQYFGASMSDSEIFKPVTDLLEKSVPPGTVHVTTILNLDAALWGTTGFVISELEKNKRMHPQATIVVDDKGQGVVEWELGEAGLGLLVLDKNGIVKYFTREGLSEAELASVMALVRTHSGS